MQGQSIAIYNALTLTINLNSITLTHYTPVSPTCQRVNKCGVPNGYDTIRYGRLTCPQKLTIWPA